MQSQSITVDRQMRRYSVPRLAFINKCDRAGAEPWRVLNQMREKLRLNCAAVQAPIGLEAEHRGLVDLLAQKAYLFEGPFGNEIKQVRIWHYLLRMPLVLNGELNWSAGGSLVDSQKACLFGSYGDQEEMVRSWGCWWTFEL